VVYLTLTGILLGSAALDLIQGASETLAGRISYIELGSMNCIEVAGYASQEQLWIRGGFPRSLLANDDYQSFSWREDFILSYLERDIPALGPRVPAETLRRLWTMVAHSQGQVINQSEIASSLGMSVPTIRRYLDLFVDLMLLRRLQPWAGNVKKRLIKSPKHYVRDSGLLHTLLNINSYDSLLGNPVIGKSWEGFVIENLLSITPKHIVPLFFEAVSNAEIDLLLEDRNQQLIAIEIKHSLSPKLKAGFYSACQTINPIKKYIVYSGNENYHFDEQIQVVSLIKMMEIVSNL
jgi:predicted AAA+ superfamily ATPase